MSLFHRGHYNKLAAVIGRRVAVEEISAGNEYVLIDLVGALVWEFKEDNDEFDENLFMEAVTKHAEKYRETLHSNT